MPKILLNISEQQHEALKERSEQCGITVSELSRRIFDLFFCEEGCKGKKSSRDNIICPLINPTKEKKHD